MNRPGIYTIKNTVDNKVYVGSSKVDVQSRIRGHISGLKAGSGFKEMQSDYDRLEGKGFEFKVVEYLSPDKNVLEREDYYISLLEGLKGYNTKTARPHGSKTITITIRPEEYSIVCREAEKSGITKSMFAAKLIRMWIEEYVREAKQ